MSVLKKTKLITDVYGKTTDVILDVKTYEKILQDLEELYMIKQYDNAKIKTDEEIRKGNFITLGDYQKKRIGKYLNNKN